MPNFAAVSLSDLKKNVSETVVFCERLFSSAGQST